MRTPSPPVPASNRPSQRPPLRWISVLTLVVLLGHWVLLSDAALPLALTGTAQTTPAPTFSTRTLEPTPIATTKPPAPKRQRKRQATPPQAAPVAQDADEPSSNPAQATIPDTVASLSETHALGIDAAPPPTATDQAAEAPPQTTPSAEPPRFQFPASVRLKYEVRGKEKGLPFFLSSELLWQHDGTHYDARLQLSVLFLGSKIQTSTGQIGPQGLEPRRYGEKWRGEVAAHFERDKGKVVFSANTPEVPLQPGAQDHVSTLMQLAALVAGANGQIPPGTTWAFQAIGPRSAETLTFTAQPPEKLELPGGEVSTLRLRGASSNEYAPQMDVWLAPSLNYLPVRVRLTKSEDHYADQQWVSTEKP